MFQSIDIKKKFEDLTAVDVVSFEINTGEIYGLLGPNGAGKSTIINMITGLLKPDSGSFSFLGNNCLDAPVAFKKSLGVAPQEIALYQEMSALENMKFWGAIHGVSKRELKPLCQDIAEKVGLQDRLKSPVKTFSGGMKRRLNLAVAILHRPKLLLLDEPTAGVDPQSRHHILELVRELADNGTSVLYTTHYLEEAETLCDRIGIIDHGKIIAEGTLTQLCDTVKSGRIVCLDGRFEITDISSALSAYNGLTVISSDSHRIVVRLDQDENLIHFMKTVFNRDLEIHSLSVKPPSLETVFLMLTGKELRD